VPETEEIARVVPVIRELTARLPATVRVSVDTYKAATARAALAAGATAINDVSGGLLDAEILRVAAAGHAAMVVGHLRGQPADMQAHVHFDNVVDEVADELSSRVAAARAAGCREVWADPGIGFGKHLDHNLRLLKHLARVRARVGVPIMVGVSRKRFIGDVTGRSATERIFGTAAAVAVAIMNGADAVRVHDVAAMRDVVRVAEAIAAAGELD
jgi:dihydropteroate synthase